MKDERLIQKAISGDSSAFCKLVEKYFDSVCSALCSLITDPLDAEEIAQEAFLRAYLYLRKLRRPSSFRSWVMRIAFNLAMDQARRRMREPQFISLSEIDPDRLQMPSFEDDILRDELVREASEAIDGLPDMDGEMVRKWIFEERSYRDLSEEYNMSYDAVAKRIRRGLKKVKRRVRERLSGIILMPWEKMLKLMGGVVMKVSTKVAITGAVVLMLGGVGIWLSYHGEEKPVPKADEVKVERQANVETPARVALRKPKPKKEKDVITFEEFNRLLDEYFAKEGKEEGNKQEVYPDVKPDVNEGKKQEEPGKEAKEATSGTQRTPEQQRLYEILESITWVWDEMNELSHQRADIAKQLSELNKVMPRDPKTGMIDGDWYMKYYYPLEKKMGELDARDRELRKIYYGTLRRYFPEAITESGNQISVDFNKLRKYVGGPLPWDPKR